jgi:hypothetical protein
MLTINSYLRTTDGSFRRVAECTDPPADVDYVEGAVEITVDGVEIIGCREWDYVNQLRSYLSVAAEELGATGAAHTYFPDQPIKLELQRQGNRVLISSTVGDQVRRASVERTEFAAVLKATGLRFFDEITSLVPELTDRYVAARARLAAL